MKAKKIISMVLILVLVLSNFAFANGTNPAQITKDTMQKQLKEVLKQQLVNNMKKFDEQSNTFKHVDYDGAVSPVPGKADRMDLYKNTDKVRVIVELQGDPVAVQAVKNCKTIDSLSTTEKASIEKSLDVIHTQTKAAMQSKMLDVKVKYDMKTVFNGFTAEVSKKDLAILKTMPNVKKVTVANMYYPEMSNAIDYTNAAAAWNNPELGYKGEGMVIAIIDTGIDWRHSDLKLTDPSKAAWDQAKVEAELAKGISGKFFTSKVPVGWNWADNNDEVLDLGEGASMHGMHVAGIAAANGKIKGVAPEAQLLAEKVFSNNQETGAFSDDIIAAIDHAIKFNADVLNMSLGSSAGFVLPEDPEQAAISNAVDNGIICDISAGNSAYSTVGYDYPLSINPDIAEVGSPGLLPDSVNSAAANNKLYLFEHAVNVAGMTPITGYGKDSWANMTGDLQLVALGGSKLGAPEDYNGIDVTGKIVLVYRGSLTFNDKIVNAMQRGAAGVICYDHGNGTFYKDQGGLDIPFMLITKANGLALEDALKKGPVTFTVNQTKKSVDPTSGQPTSFSSWGPTPDLGFKPDFMAPGGNIYSLANNDKYQYMSGTSMSSPHMAGGMALVAQYLNKFVADNKMTLTDRQFVELAKTLAMNTAEPVFNKYGYEYQPRLQGAGMMKIDRAMKTPVYITGEDGYPGVSLKEMGENKEFTLTLTNMTATEQTYDVNATIATDYIYDDGYDSLISIYMDEENYDADHVATISPDKQSVTVPANSKATVKVAINVVKAPKNIFIEGYVYFKPHTAGIPQLTVPYFGFYGDWNEPSIIDPASSQPNSYFGYTGLLSEIDGQDGYLYTDVISPANKDLGSLGSLDSVVPIISFLRNAKDFMINIKDSNGTEIRTITSDTDVRKVYDLDEGKNPYKFYDNWKWDGKAFNNATGTYGYVADGNYTVELKSRIDYQNAKWQTVELPVMVDNTAPAITVPDFTGEDNDGKVTATWTTDEKGSGVAAQMLVVFEMAPVAGSDPQEFDLTGNMTPIPVAADVNSADVQLPYKYNNITVMALDNAYNTGMNADLNVVTNLAYAHQGAPKVVITSPENLGVYKSNTLTVQGYIDTPTLYDGVLKVNGKEVSVDPDNSFSTQVTYDKDGWNDVQVEAYYKDLYDPSKPETIENRTAYAYKIVVDTTTPDITVGVGEGMKGFIYNGIKYVTVNGNVKDASSIGYNVTVNGDKILNQEFDDMTVLDQNFQYAGKLDGTDNMIFTATDLANNSDTVTVNVYEENGWNITNGVAAAKITFEDITATYAGPAIKSITPEKTAVVNGNRADVAVTAESVVGIKEVYLNDREATLKDGKYVLNIPVVDGVNPVRVRVVDNLGLSKEEITTVTADNQGPAIELTMPYLTTSAATYDVTGIITDTTTIASFKINGTDVVPAEDGSFKQTINVALGNNDVTIAAADQLGHKTEMKLTVNRVTGSPAVNVKTIQSGLVRYNSAIVLKAESDRPVDWTVTIKDMNGVQVDQLTGHGMVFAHSWTPQSTAPTGRYTVEYKAGEGELDSTTALGSIDVYNLPIQVTGVKTADSKNVDKNTFKTGDVVMVKANVKAIDADTTGLVVVQVVGPDKKPFTFRFNPDMAIKKTGSTTQLGFSLDGLVLPGQYTVEVYVWKNWDSIEPLSTVGTYSFVVEQ